MMSTAMPSSACSSFTRARICAWIVTSSAVVGSSAIRSDGRHTSAIAIIARWRRPPDSSNGYILSARAGFGKPTRRSISSVRSMPSLRPTRWCRNRGSLTWSPIVWSGDSDTIGSWKIIEMCRPRIRRSAMPSGFSLVMSRGGFFVPGAVKRILPDVMCAVFGRMPIIACAVTDFPEPDSPTSATVEPGRIRNEMPIRARAPSCRDCRIRWKDPEPRSGLLPTFSPPAAYHCGGRAAAPSPDQPAIYPTGCPYSATPSSPPGARAVAALRRQGRGTQRRNAGTGWE